MSENQLTLRQSIPAMPYEAPSPHICDTIFQALKFDMMENFSPETAEEVFILVCACTENMSRPLALAVVNRFWNRHYHSLSQSMRILVRKSVRHAAQFFEKDFRLREEADVSLDSLFVGYGGREGKFCHKLAQMCFQYGFAGGLVNVIDSPAVPLFASVPDRLLMIAHLKIAEGRVFELEKVAISLVESLPDILNPEAPKYVLGCEPGSSATNDVLRALTTTGFLLLLTHRSFQINRKAQAYHELVTVLRYTNGLMPAQDGVTESPILPKGARVLTMHDTGESLSIVPRSLPKRLHISNVQGWGDIFYAAAFLPYLDGWEVEEVIFYVPSKLRDLLDRAKLMPHVRFANTSEFMKHEHTESDRWIDGMAFAAKWLGYPAHAYLSHLKFAEYDYKWAPTVGMLQHYRSSGYRVIGLCWRGSVTHPNDANRSISLSQFESMFSDYSESYGNFKMVIVPLCPQYMDDIPEESFRPHRVPSKGKPSSKSPADKVRLYLDVPSPDSFSDTAFLLKQCEHVWTVDTAVAHLSGVMGLPTSIMIPLAADYRWGLEAPDGFSRNPYPSAKMYRQITYMSWGSALSKAWLDLLNTLNKPPAETPAK